MSKPVVTINGVTAMVSVAGNGKFTFVSDQRVPLPFPLTHVQVRAENVTGAFGVAGKIVTLDDEDGPLETPEVESEGLEVVGPASVKPFRVKVYGPKLLPGTITGRISGVHSHAFTPALPLTDERGGAVAFSLNGAGPNGPVQDLTPTSVVTSLTIQPLTGLHYGTRYTLRLSSAIVDSVDAGHLSVRTQWLS